MSLVIDDEIAIVGDTMFGVLKKSVFPPYADDSNISLQYLNKILDIFYKKVIFVKSFLLKLYII